jgi:diguanylate cyclase (GGDEF)-like protein/PAS domain S-box-containing protein
MDQRKLSIGAVLGLRETADEESMRMRGLQYVRMAESSRIKLTSHVLAALATLWLIRDIVGVQLVGLWLTMLAGALWYSLTRDSALREADRRRISAAEFRRHALGAAVLGLIWVIPVAWFTHRAAQEARLELWTIVAVLLTVSAVVIPVAPLASLAFSGILGLSTIAGFVAVHDYPMSFVAAVFVATIMLGTIETSRHFLLSRLAQAGVAEQTEVVSMLLREYEEGDADWLWETDAGRKVRGVSRRFAYSLGLEAEEIDGKALLQLVAGSAWETGQFHASLHDLAERLKRREAFSNLMVRVSARGEMRWWELSGKPRFDANGDFDGFRGVGSDVTEQRESSEKIAYLARFDVLTGLPNRMMLTEALADAMRYAEQWRTRCAFLMIDLDRFKSVNDSLGHLVGDQLLARVSDRLKSLMTENELCGRLGGDEFAIVIRDASDLARVSKVAHAVIDSLSAPYSVDHHTLYVGASVGSAIGPRDGSSVEELMRNADLALYRAKDVGGGSHCSYEPSLHAQAEERRRLEFALRHALERKELELHYQPVVDAHDEHVVSFEALLRWHNRDLGMISPVKFIPIAEDTRLIVPIGEWVLREACREAMNWPSHVKVAVNVSGEQLLDPGFIASVVTALATTNLAPQRLEIEVTESIFLRDANTARAALDKIGQLGCSVALDDFGTGYSSLGYLRTMRFSTIKVDRSFVQGAAAGSRESVAIIRAVVAMADSLEMSTTAEGVETEEQLALIRQFGCTKIQGYYYGRPMPAADARELFPKASPERRGAA